MPTLATRDGKILKRFNGKLLTTCPDPTKDTSLCPTTMWVNIQASNESLCGDLDSTVVGKIQVHKVGLSDTWIDVDGKVEIRKVCVAEDEAVGTGEDHWAVFLTGCGGVVNHEPMTRSLQINCSDSIDSCYATDHPDGCCGGTSCPLPVPCFDRGDAVLRSGTPYQLVLSSVWPNSTKTGFCPH